MSKKYGTEKLSTSVRMLKKDWEVVAELAMQRGYNMTDATHELIESGQKWLQFHPRNEANNTLSVETNNPINTPKEGNNQPCNVASPLDIAKQRLAGMGITMSGNKIETTPRAPQEASEYVPFYDRTRHKKGDRVRFPGRPGIYTVPEMDGDGNPVLC